MSTVNLLKICTIFVTIICATQGARILGIFHMPFYSHFLLGDRVFKELAARGHEVTVITPFELKTPVKNLNHIVLTGFMKKLQVLQSLFLNVPNGNLLSNFIYFNKLTYNLTESALNHTNVQNLLKSDTKFDLVIHELFGNEAFHGFANFYKVPSVTLSTIGATWWANSQMGNPHNPAYLPEFFLSYPTNMNLKQRIINTLVYIGQGMFANLYMMPKQNQLLQQYFPGSPNLDELHYNTSLMLLNSHFSTQYPLPLVPNMIEIGGYHIQPSKPLPKDLQDYLDNSKDGVVFFSMGSIIKSKDMPPKMRKEIMNALGKLKQNVLWKWEDGLLPGQPSNIKVEKWLPQQDILAHPNVKLFITHGGNLGTTEASYFGVPVLGLPVYGDQELNIRNIKEAGCGIGIPFREVDETSFSAALREVLNNPKYATVAKQRSKIMRDQQQKPLDTAIYWIEYVIRHQGAPHLRTAALNLYWFQVLLLDVALGVILSAIAILYILRKLTILICGKQKKSIDTKKKQN